LKILWIVIFYSIEAMSFDVDTASKIFNKILTGIFSKPTIYVYTPNPSYVEVIHRAKNLVVTKNKTKADILLLTDLNELRVDQNRLSFTTSLSVLRKRETVIGAFYWEYGRPKIVFIKKRLEHSNISLAKPFEKYIVEELP